MNRTMQSFFADKVYSEMIDQVRVNLNVSILGNLGLALISISFLYKTVPSMILLIWLLTHLVLTYVRIYTVKRLEPIDHDLTFNYVVYGITLSFLGLGWGILSLLAAWYSPGLDQILLALIVTGLTAGSVATMTPIFMGFKLYFFAAVFPVFIGFALSSTSSLQHVSPVVLLYMYVVYSAGKHLHGNILNTILLKREQDKLNQELLEQKLLAESANQAKTTFLSSMSHELRTPLNSVLGFAQLLQMDSLSADQEENVKEIIKAGEHLLTLINEVLELSRIEVGDFNLQLDDISVDEVINKALTMLRPVASKNTITLGYDSNSTFVVKADERYLLQVLLNLISNAIKYNKPEGDVRIRCDVTNDSMLRIHVVDNGMGIAEQHKDKIFSAFQRLGKEASSIQGTGIGLYFSKQLVERMGGSVGFESTVGQETHFWIDLPLVI